LQVTRGRQRYIVVGVFLAVTIALPGLVAVFGDTIVSSVSDLGGAKAEHTAESRLVSYAQAVSLIAKYPFGVGYEEYHKWSDLIVYVHNMWLKLFLAGGIFSAASMLALFWLAYQGGGGRAGQQPLLAGEPAQVVASPAAVFIAVEFYPGLSDIMWVMLGTLISFNWVRRQRGPAQAPPA
jgi:O-antigen ligase